MPGLQDSALKIWEQGIQLLGYIIIPQSLGRALMSIYLYVEDAIFKQAVAAGTKVCKPVAAQFHQHH